MNDLGWVLLGSCVRVTILAALGLAAAWLARRRGPMAGAMVTSTTLGVVVAVSGLAFCPWPRWWSPGGLTTARPDQGRASNLAAPDHRPDGGGPSASVATPARFEPAPAAGLAEAFLREFRRELAASAESSRPEGWRWPAWAAVAFLAGLAVAMARLGLGLRSVATIRSRSRPVADPTLLALAASLGEAMGLRRTVEVRESPEVGTPATVGWLRPALLLPPSWPGWDERERRAVLAHELAHVLRGDYPAGIAARFGVSLHFYHPLVHALAGRLRLQQELAADSWGARLSGGRLPYLTTLANLALRQDPGPVSWPARPFLPSRGTFLRRIEMLRDPNAIPPPSLPRRGQAATVAALLAAGLALAGLRGPAPSPRAQAQDTPAPKGATPSRVVLGDFQPMPLDATSASSDVHLVVDIRPAGLLKAPELKKLAGQIPADGPAMLAALGSGEIVQILVLGFERQEGPPPPNSSIPPQSAFILRAARPYDFKPFLVPKVEEVQSDGITYFRAGTARGSTCFRRLDDRTLLIGIEADAKLPPIGPDRPRGRHAWDDAWTKLAVGPIRVAFDAPWLARRVQPAMPPGRLAPPSPVTALFGPLLDKAQAYALTLDVADGLALDAVATCDTEPGAGRVADTLRASLTLARNALPDFRRAAEAAPDAARPMVDLVDALDAMVEGARIDREQAVVRLHAKADAAAVAMAVRMLLPAVSAAREAARRAVCINNLKQIGLAMHNYHAANGHFPPAVLMGPDGKTPHSWRVALLPYLEASTVHSRYRFDEPWDGPNNSKLIPLMPAIYAHPESNGPRARPGLTDYFVPTGPETMFPDRKEGMTMAEVTDGLSYTILVVEARREVPWTKPEDIPYDKGSPLPDLASPHPGGFNAAFGDGAVRFLSATIDPTVLRNLFTRAGGEIVSIPSTP